MTIDISTISVTPLIGEAKTNRKTISDVTRAISTNIQPDAAALAVTTIQSNIRRRRLSKLIIAGKI